MANPQKKNGSVPIANEIFDALCHIRIPGEVMQIILVIIRKTYGWNKKEDAISLSQFCLITGMKKPNVCRAINNAVKMNLIIKKDNDIANKYIFNKDFDTWKPLSKKITVIKKDNASLSKKIHTKYTTTKYTNTPYIRARGFFNSEKQQNQLIIELKEKGFNDAKQEIDNFISYWTELNKSGTKQRWELEKTFEINRRLTTWFRNKEKFGFRKKGGIQSL